MQKLLLDILQMLFKNFCSVFDFFGLSWNLFQKPFLLSYLEYVMIFNQLLFG